MAGRNLFPGCLVSGAVGNALPKPSRQDLLVVPSAFISIETSLADDVFGGAVKFVPKSEVDAQRLATWNECLSVVARPSSLLQQAVELTSKTAAE